MGKRNSPFYRLVVVEKSRSPQADGIETLGTYDPTTEPKTVDFKEDRIEHWLDEGAKPSDTVHNLLIEEGIISDEKKNSVHINERKRAELEEEAAEEEEDESEEQDSDDESEENEEDEE